MGRAVNPAENRRGPGRPAIAPSSRKYGQGLSVTPEQWAAYEACAAEDDVSVSAWITTLADREVGRRKKAKR
jgi:hypothetical protein